MDRQIKETDSYSDKLLKYIPAEVSGAYLSINSFVSSSEGFSPTIVFSLLCLTVLCVVYCIILLKIKSKLQIVATVILFLVWALNISATRVENVLNPTLLGVVLILVTAALPLLPVPVAAAPVPPPPLPAPAPADVVPAPAGGGLVPGGAGAAPLNRGN